MKQEASKKSKKWLWLVLGLVALLAVAGVVLALVFGGGSGDTDEAKGGRPELYWNVARQSHLDPETSLSNREPAADGLFYITFARDGEQVEYAVADKKTVNYIDSMDIMGLVFDNDGLVVDVINPLDLATEVGKGLYVQNVSGNMLVANSSIAMNGMRFNINITEKTEIYEVSGAGEFEGVKIEPAELLAMDTITIYANDLEEITHIYLIDHPDESKVYWRATQKWNSTEKTTAREPDENGDYTLDFFCEGELVYFKTKDISIATKIDNTSRYSAHFGLRFDEDGYVVEILNSAIASRTMLACQRFDITEFDGETFTATRLLTNDGSFYTGTVTADTRIYDVSGAAKSEGRAGKAVDSIQMGDRVCVWTDPNGNVVLIYISNRLVDSPAYYLPTRKYSTKTGETTLEPNAQGVYEVELLREGDNKNTVYKTTDKDLMTQIHKPSDKCVGLKVDENNNIIYVYDVEALFGYTYYCRGRYVSETAGMIASFMLPSDLSVKNGVLAANCKFYNVSKIGEYGAETTLQVGDYVYCWKQPSGEILHGYVIRRYIGEETQYYNLKSMYDKETMTSTRKPAEDGWYYFDMANQGKKVTLKTKDKALVDAIDTLGASLPCMTLKVSGDVIIDVMDPTYSTGGAKIASGYKVKSIEGDTITAYYKQKEVTFTLADNVQIYNVSAVVGSHQGEKGTIKIGDMISAFTNIEGKATIVWVRGRQVDNMYWKLDRFYDSTNKVTSRVPDADGWYWYNLAVNGEVKRLKTKDIEIASSMDNYEGAFGLHVVGDEIKGFTSVSNVKDCSGNGATGWTVTKVNGNKITLTYTLPGASEGKTQQITLASNAKIYDVSDSAEKFGAKTTLKVGDFIRTYLSEDGETHQYVYVRAHCTRKDGYMSYCDHCDKVVYWNPLIKNSSMSKNDSHYYLTADIENSSQVSIGSESRDYENVLDLNGHSMTRVGGRAFLVRYNDALTIIDSVGGGSVTGNGNGASGGTILVSSGGKLNLYAGTISLTDDENVKPGYGGVINLAGKESVFNMYGGTLSGGRSYMTSSYGNARGGNLYVSAATFNMYGGTIIGGKAYNGDKPVLDKEGNPVLDSDGKPKTELIRSYGGNIYVATGGVLNITGGTITEGWAEGYGGNISSNSTANKVNLIGATITNGSADYRGGNLSAGYGTWLIDGGTKITGGFAGEEKTSGYGGNMMINYADVTVNKALIDDASVGYHGTGGNIYCLYDGTLTLNEGAVVSNGFAYGTGGNIYVAGAQYNSTTKAYDKKFTLTINGGKVIGGISTNGHGGNICMSGYSADADGDGKKEYVGGSIFYMLAGEVSGGTCPDGKYGGNIYLQVDEAKISGGKIFGGKQADNEYDIYVPGEGTGITVSGGEVAGKFRVNALNGVTVEGNPVLGQLNLAKNAMITVGELKSGAEIAVMVTVYTPGGVFTNAFSKAQDYYNAGYFTAYEAGKMVYFTADNELCVVTERLIDPNAYTAYCEHCQQNVEWSEWSYLSGSGHYYLNDTYTLVNSPVMVAEGEDIIIDLKGKSITAQDNLAFDVEGTLSILDSATGGLITGTGPSSGTAHGGLIRVNGGTLNLYSGVLKLADNQYRIAGGGVLYVQNDAIFNMYGGELAGGVADGNPNASNTNTQKGRGANLYNTGSVCNLYAGKIYGGKAGLGGNVYNGSSGEINFLGTEVYGGEATKSGGGNVYSESGKLTFVDSSITGGTATSTGSNIYLYSSNLVAEFNGGNYDGEIYARGVSSLAVSGAPTIAKLSLHSSVLLNLDGLTGGSVKVAAGGVFTGVLNNADAYLTYITAFESGKKVAVTTAGELTVVDDSSSGGGNEGQEPVDPTQTPFNDVYTNAVAMTTNGVFDNASAVTAPCPYCSANGDTADKQWSALGAAGELTGGHYYVAENITGNTTHYTVSGNVCLHLNGNDITSSARAFHVAGSGSLNVMGDGIVTGGFKSASNSHYAATLDSVGTVNLCGGTWKRANDAPVIDGRATSADGTINIYNGTTVQGDSQYTGYALIALYQKTVMNIYGGTVTGGTWTGGTGGNIYMLPSTTAGRVTALNVYGGTISGGNANQGGNIYAAGGAGDVTVLISGGTITGGSVYAENNVTSVTVTGTPVIENLDLSAGTVIDLGTLSGTASVAVTADGVFTDVLTNADTYLTYISAYETGKVVEVTTDSKLSIVAENGAGEEEAPTATPFNDVYAAAVQQTANGVFDNASTVTAPCPYCSANGDTADKEWTALETVTGTSKTLGDGHYFLADSITDNAGYYTAAGNVCVHLNGKDITTAEGKLAFYADSTGTLNVMGEGTVTGSRRNSSKPTWAATLENIGTVNLCGGTWKRANNSPVLGSRGTGTCMVNIYNGTTIQGDSNYTEYALISVASNTRLSMYGGIITGGTWTDGNGGNIRVFNSANADRVSSVTIYGGIISGGTATLGGNIYVEGGNGHANLEIAGGTITDGSVYVKKKGSTLTVSGNAQVENLDVSDGTILNVSGLSDIAHIGITATGVFTDVLTNANDYLNYIKAYEVGKEIVITSDQKLYIQADVDSYANGYCPCGCGLKLDQITWTEITFDETKIDTNYKVMTSGHYRVMEDVITGNGNLFQFESVATNVVIDMNGKAMQGVGRFAHYNQEGNLYVVDTVGTASYTLIDSYTLGEETKNHNKALTGIWLYTKGHAEIYGGTWNSLSTCDGTGTSSSNPRMLTLNSASLEIYGGTFNATGVNANAGIMGTYGTTANTITIYGGEFIGGNGSGKGDLWKINAASTLDIRGGEFQGQIYAAAESTILVSGDVQITDLDLTEGAKLSFGMLTKDASIKLNGTGELTVANANAQAYVDAGYISAYDASAALTVEENVIIVTAATNP